MSTIQSSPVVETRDSKETGILAAARAAFLESGYAATSMDQVAQRARASKTTLYTRFPSKEALFAAVVVAECEAYGLGVPPTELADLEIDEALRRIGQRFLGLICSPETMRVEQIVLGEASRFPEIAAVFTREGPERVCAAVAGYFFDAAARGLMTVPDPEFAAEQFLSALKGSCQYDMMLGQALSGPELDEYIRKAVELFLNGARGR